MLPIAPSWLAQHGQGQDVASWVARDTCVDTGRFLDATRRDAMQEQKVERRHPAGLAVSANRHVPENVVELGGLPASQRLVTLTSIQR